MPPPPLPEGYLDNVVLATIHCHVLRNVRLEIPDLIGNNFSEEKIKEARDMLVMFMKKPAMKGHNTTIGRTAAVAFAEDIVKLMGISDSQGILPVFMVSSDQLLQVPIARDALKPSDVVPISARMCDLENSLKVLTSSVESLKKDTEKNRKAEETLLGEGVPGIGPQWQVGAGGQGHPVQQGQGRDGQTLPSQGQQGLVRSFHPGHWVPGVGQLGQVGQTNGNAGQVCMDSFNSIVRA